MTLARARENLSLGLVTGYFILDYFFMQIRVPPVGFGMPLGELFLGLALLTINVPSVMRKMGRMMNLLPLLVWWTFGFTRLAVDSLHHGMWAFRDATQLVESLYIIVGFSIAANPGFIDRFMKWLPWVLAIACVYGFGYSYQIEINDISPGLPGGSGQMIPIFGTYQMTATMVMWGAFYLLAVQEGHPRSPLGRIAIAALLIGFAVVVVQTRTIYLQLIAMIVILFLFMRSGLARMSLVFPVLVIIVAAIMVFHIPVSGRLTDKVSFSFFLDHFASVFGEAKGHSIGVKEAAEGVGLRFTWWMHLYHQLTSDWARLLSGLGYGVALTNFVAPAGTLVREPHNSLISVVSRLGLIGFLAWAWVYAEIFVAWFRTFRLAQRFDWRQGQEFLLLVLCFAALLLVSTFAEDTLEKPYDAIPLYLFFGMMLRSGYMLTQKVMDPRDVASIGSRMSTVRQRGRVNQPQAARRAMLTRETG
jgi:hypothetical protein